MTRGGKIGLMAGLAVAAAAVAGLHRPVEEFLFRGDRPLRYGKVSAVSGAVVRSEPSRDASPIRTLPQGTILAVLGQSGGGEPWHRVRLRSGEEGWCPGSLFRFYPIDRARHDVLQDLERFEERLREEVGQAASRFARALHPAGSVAEVRITSPIQATAAAAFEVNASVLMDGENGSRVDLTVHLDLDVDPNLLSRGTIRVRDLIEQAQTGSVLAEPVDLAAKLVPLLL